MTVQNQRYNFKDFITIVYTFDTNDLHTFMNDNFKIYNDSTSCHDG